MITVKILINSIEKVMKFTSILGKEDIDCEIIEGMHIIDAKSIMGIFSIDLSKPLQLNIHSDNKEIVHKIKDYIVEEQ